MVDFVKGNESKVFEALRRSYAEAGLNLVDGSFEEGGTLTSVSDVLLHKESGKAYSGPAGTVAAGTDPESGGFVDRSGLALRSDLASESGSELVGYQPAGNGAVSTTVQTNMRAVSGDLGDYSVDNNLFIFCGDSTTEQMGGAGYGFDRLTIRRNAGEKWEKVLGTINFGGSGYTINGFVNDAAGTLPVVSTSNIGVGQWDYYGHKPIGPVSLATSMAWRSGKADRVTWVLCFGINDCILYASVGNLSQAAITSYIAERLNKAVTTIRANYPQDKIVLRVPNPMTARPYNAGAGFPSATAYPTFGADLAADQALVEKWNQALRNAYLAVSNNHPGTILFDTWTDVFGVSNTTLSASTQLPYLGNLVHPSMDGYNAIVESLVDLLSGKFNGSPVRRHEAELRAVLLSNSAWENFAGYFLDNPAYKKVFSSENSPGHGLISIGPTYIDIPISLASFQQTVDTTKPLYISLGNKAAQKFSVGYSASAIGNNTRLLSVSPTAAMQSASAETTVFLFQEGIVLPPMVANDSYVNSAVSGKKEYYSGIINGGGSGYIDLLFAATNGRFSSKFPDGLVNASIAVGGSVATTLSLATASAVSMAGTPSQRAVRVAISGSYSTWVNKPMAVFFTDDVPSPKAYEDVVITGTTSETAETQTAHAHGLGYKPKRVQLLPTSNGVVYQSASPDATNLYVKGSSASLTFIAYAK